MLTMMGYKAGQGIGRSVIGRAEPVGVSLKQGRHGLGVEEGKRRQREAAEQRRRDQGGRFLGR
jgi:G-patch domain